MWTFMFLYLIAKGFRGSPKHPPSLAQSMLRTSKEEEKKDISPSKELGKQLREIFTNGNFILQMLSSGKFPINENTFTFTRNPKIYLRNNIENIQHSLKFLPTTRKLTFKGSVKRKIK